MKKSRMLRERLWFAVVLVMSFYSTANSQTSCCQDGFKPEKITLKYTGESCTATQSTQSSDKYGCSGNPAFDSLVYVIASNSSTPGSGDIWFSGNVALNGNFTLDVANAGQDKFASNTVVHVYNQQNGTLIQTVNFHTSCSQPLVIGEQYGSLKLQSMSSAAGGTCGPTVQPGCERVLTNTTSCVNKKYVLYLVDSFGTAYWITGSSSTYKWIENVNGTVTIKGEGFTHPDLSGDMFTVDINLSDLSTSPPVGSPKSNYCGSNGSMTDWQFYSTVSGTVTSSLHGVFNVSKRGAAFQQGTNANTTQLGYGASGWFYLSGGDGFFKDGDINAMLSTNCETPSKESCCVSGFKPQKITMRYTGQDCSATSTEQTSDKHGCNGSPMFDSEVYVIANNSDNPASGSIWFSGLVSLDSIFNIDATSVGETKLSSNTVIHIYNSQGGTLLQKVNFHTSCSQPLNQNDQYGAMRVEGMISEGGATCGIVPNTPGGNESCCKDGFKPKKITMQYTGESCSATSTAQTTDKYSCSGNPANDALVYIIANSSSDAASGSIWFSGEVVLDSFFTIDATKAGASKLPSNTFVHIYNTQGGTKIQTINFHTSCSQPLNVHDQWGSAKLIGMVSETGVTCGNPENNPPANESCCVDGFKPQKITLKYTGGNCAATSTSQSSDKHGCSGDPLGDQNVYVISNDNSNAGSGNIWFSGNVNLNSMFTIDATLAGSTRFSSNTYIHVYNQQNGTKIQTINFHTSCSQPLVTGDQWGSMELISMVSETGAKCGTAHGSGLTNLITGYTFYDLNRSKIFETGEPSISTMLVTLYDDKNCNGSIDVGDNALSTTTTDNNGYYQFSRNWKGGPFELIFPIEADNDDAEQETNGSMDMGHDYLRLRERTVGLHFKDIGIPQGTIITSAHIEFTSYNGESGAAAVRIKADDVDNSNSITSSNNNLSSRTQTSNYVDWTLGAWVEDSKYTSPDIKDVVQEILDRALWSDGNDMTLIISQLSGSGKRKSYSHDKNENLAPRLVMTYDLPGYKECYITKVDTTTEPDQNSLTTLVQQVAEFTSGDNVDSMNNFGFYGELPEGYNLIKGTVFGDANENAILNTTELGLSPVIVSLYKDVNCNDAFDNSDILLRNTTTRIDGTYSFAVMHEPINTTKTFNVVDKNDDSEQHADGKNDLGHDHLHLNERTIAMRYQSVSIPQGAVITSARILFASDNDENDAATVRIFANNVNSSLSLTNSDNYLSSLATTSAFQNWALSGWVKEQKYNSPDISNVIQEVVNRGGWASGNNLTIIIKPVAGSGRRKATSFDESENLAPKLFITYNLNGNEDCYLTKIGKVWPPTFEYLTTDSVNAQTFTGINMVDSMNDFGLWGSTAVPVSLLEFDVKWDKENAVLTWVTASEDNNSHFEIQRSLNGVQFTNVGKHNSLANGGSSQRILHYDFTDPYIKSRIEEVVFYRLKQVDFNGEHAFSQMVMLNKETNRTNDFYTVYPNPTDNNVEIRLTKNLGTAYRIALMDINGKLIQSHEVISSQENQRFLLEMSHLDRGVYFLRVESNRRIQTERIILNR